MSLIPMECAMVYYTLLIFNIVLLVTTIFLIYYIVFVANKRQSNLTLLFEKTKSENESLKRQINSTISQKESIITEFQNFKTRLKSSSNEIDPRELKIGDVFFTDRRFNELFSIVDIKNMTLRIENISTGEKINIQYPFDMVGVKHYKINGMIDTSTVVTSDESISDFKDGC